MQIFIITLLIIGALVGGFFLGRFLTKRNLKKEINKGTGRLGIIEVINPSRAVIEIEELENAGDKTKIYVKKIHCRSYYKDDIETRFNNPWVNNADITWYNDNTQRMRDERIKKVLS